MNEVAKIKVIITAGEGGGQGRAAIIAALESLNCQRRGAGSSAIKYEIVTAKGNAQRDTYKMIFQNIKWGVSKWRYRKNYDGS